MLRKTKAKKWEPFIHTRNIPGFAICPWRSFNILVTTAHFQRMSHIFSRRDNRSQISTWMQTWHEKSGILGFPHLNVYLPHWKVIPDLLYFLRFSLAISNTICRSSEHLNFETFDAKQFCSKYTGDRAFWSEFFWMLELSSFNLEMTIAIFVHSVQQVSKQLKQYGP